MRADQFDERRDLILLAAEANEKHADEIGMARVTNQRAAQELHSLAGGVETAAKRMRQGQNAVDARPGRQPLGAEMVGNGARHGGRAIDGRDHRQVVARADLAVGAAITEEGRARRGEIGRNGRGWSPGAGFAGKFAHPEVVRVHVTAGFNVGQRDTDDLAVAAQRRAFADQARGELVSGRDRVADGNPGSDGFAGQKLTQRDQHVVIGVQVEGGSSGHRRPHTSFRNPPRGRQGETNRGGIAPRKTACGDT